MSTFASTALQDKVAIVTGGGTGIGRVIAREMAKVGAHIVVASRNPEHIHPAAEEIQQLGRQSLAVSVDVRVTDQVDNLVKATLDRFGRIDILVNNHGALFQCAVEDLSPGGWNAIIGINLTGVFLCSRAVGKVMIQQKRGKNYQYRFHRWLIWIADDSSVWRRQSGRHELHQIACYGMGQA
jgi:NAD(P)-dependent dehydrogenase (short-subunit alcohol dehydrogenase family)